MKRSIWPVLLFAAVGVAILVSLGIWQLQRLQWKEALIATVDASIAGPAIALEEAKRRPSLDYAKVRLSGEFKSQDYVLMIGTAQGGPAWSVLRPFALDDGQVLIVDLGKKREGEPPAPPAGQISVEALLRVHAGQKGLFDPDNPKQGREWFWWDVRAMAQTLGTTETGFTAQLLPGEPATEGLLVDQPKAALRNNHLGYAITWFGLAGVLVVMTGLFLLRLRREAANGTE
jgi:surfeit locus 1 family protein